MERGMRRGGAPLPQREAGVVRTRPKYQPSTVATLTDARLGEMGAFLDAETGSTHDDILLHKTQQTAPVAVGDRVKVFL